MTSSDADRLSDGHLRLVLREKHYAVQWRHTGGWVTYSRDHTTKEDALRELEEERNIQHLGWQKPEWRAVEITRITRRIEDEDSGG